MTICISFSDKTVRVAVELNGGIESAVAELPKREWQGLTDEEIEKATGCDKTKPLWLAIIGVSRAVEAKLKEKNT